MDIKGLSCHKGVVKDQIQNGKEAKNGSLVLRRSSGCSSSRRFILRRIAQRRSYRKCLWFRKMALARLDLHAHSDRLGFSLAVPQPRSFLSRRGGAAHRLARRTRAEALLGRDGRLLHGTQRSARRSPSRTGARYGQADRERCAGNLALAGAKGSRGGRLDRYHARHAGQSGGLSQQKSQ